MTASYRARTSNAAWIAILLTLVGCQQGPTGKQDAAGTLVPVIEAAAAIEVKEGELLQFRPQVANLADLPGGLSFELTGGALPQGCELDRSTGELRWTPTEMQGPDTVDLQFSCAPADEAISATQYAIQLRVVEANSPPRLDAPAEGEVSAGSTLEQAIALQDDDFPANRVSLQLVSGPEGAVVNEVGRLLYWEVPADWQEPQVTFTLAAQDDGTPPLTTTCTYVLTVTDLQTPQDDAAATTDRLPEVAVDLPPLPRPNEPIQSVPLECSLDPPVADDARLSLMLPSDLRRILKVRYLDDDYSRLAIMLARPFEAEDLPGNLRDGLVATCEVKDSQLVWTWAMTIDLTARGYQNNIRHGVLAIEPTDRGAVRLVALQKAVDVPAPTIGLLVDDEDSQFRLTAHDRIKLPTALQGLQCVADNGNWKVELQSQVDGFSAVLENPQLAQRVNGSSRSNAAQFTEFSFRISSIATEIRIELDANPSPSEASEHLRAARKNLNSMIVDRSRWGRKLISAQASLRNAQRMPEKNNFQRVAKQAAIGNATGRIRQAEGKLAALAHRIPAEENVVATMAAKRKAILDQLQPVRNCVISGELYRRVGDVRVSVLRLVPLETQTETVSTTAAMDDNGAPHTGSRGTPQRGNAGLFNGPLRYEASDGAAEP